MNRNDVLTDPKKLVRVIIENVWQQVYMLFLMCIQRMIGNLDGKAMILKELLELLLI